MSDTTTPGWYLYKHDVWAHDVLDDLLLYVDPYTGTFEWTTTSMPDWEVLPPYITDLASAQAMTETLCRLEGSP